MHPLPLFLEWQAFGLCFKPGRCILCASLHLYQRLRTRLDIGSRQARLQECLPARCQAIYNILGGVSAVYSLGLPCRLRELSGFCQRVLVELYRCELQLQQRMVVLIFLCAACAVCSLLFALNVAKSG